MGKHDLRSQSIAQAIDDLRRMRGKVTFRFSMEQLEAKEQLGAKQRRRFVKATRKNRA